MSELWTCPYCNRDCTISENDKRILATPGRISDDYGHYYSYLTIIVCPNKQCRELTILFEIFKYDPQPFNEVKELVYSWNLKPESEAKPFPSYIPAQLRNDYEEACLIKTKSPKASATLSRRCLQGMIQDFWKIKKGRLSDQINELEEHVDSTTWQAIDSVRQVGNIGAHMEKDVNLIIDVDPEEAGMLIWLIETLFEEWYITRHEKEKKMKALVKLAEDKKEDRQKTKDTKSQKNNTA